MKFILLFLVFLQCSLLADKVVIKDGSVLIGTVTEIEDGNLTLETDFAGNLRIPVSQISSINSESEISLRLEDNRTFNNKIIPADDGRIGLEGSDLSFDFMQIRHLWSGDAEDPLVLLEKKKTEALLMKWSHSLGFDFMGSSGNTDDFGLGLRADSTYGNKFREYDLYLAYNNSSKKDVTVVVETKFGVEYDSKFYERLAWYAKTDLDKSFLPVYSNFLHSCAA